MTSPIWRAHRGAVELPLSLRAAACAPYLCFLGGATFDQLTGEDETPSHVYTTIVLSAMAFVLGFTTVFVILGATATAAGQLLANNLALLAKVQE